jgi:hypothetical protein
MLAHLRWENSLVSSANREQHYLKAGIKFSVLKFSILNWCLRAWTCALYCTRYRRLEREIFVRC